MGLVNAVRDVCTIKRLLTRAEAEARSGGEQTPGPEHLLLAATALSDATAARALERVGVGPQLLRTAIEEAHASALAAVGIEVEHPSGGTAGLRSPASGIFRSTPQAQQVFQEAVALARSTQPSGLQGAHVIAAICDLEHGTTARAFSALAVDRDRLWEAACAEARISCAGGARSDSGATPTVSCSQDVWPGEPTKLALEPPLQSYVARQQLQAAASLSLWDTRWST
jgi:ATP-dependent Clp protease ATP-binding subunit ClpA